MANRHQRRKRALERKQAYAETQNARAISLVRKLTVERNISQGIERFEYVRCPKSGLPMVLHRGMISSVVQCENKGSRQGSRGFKPDETLDDIGLAKFRNKFGSKG